MPPTPTAGYVHHFAVRFSDLDANRHVRNTAYSEFATHTRLQLLASKGFDQARFERERFGPVMFREDVRYRRELHMGDDVMVDVVVSGLAEDGSRWRFEHEVKRGDGTLSATMLIEGAWIHLDERKLIAPAAELLELMRSLPRAAEFEVLPSVIRRGGGAG